MKSSLILSSNGAPRAPGLATRAGLCALGLTAFAAASAAPVSINTPYMNLENRNINSLGFSSGQFFRIGANSVIPNGSAGTTGVGSTINLVTGQTVTRNIPFTPGPVIPNFFQRLMPVDQALLGPWTLSFSNGADSAQALVSLPAGQNQAPFINSVTLSGTSAQPTFSWAPPAGTVINGYRVNIYDKSLVTPNNNGQVSSRNLLPAQTSYTVDGVDFTVPGYAFQQGRNYSIEISLMQTKDGSSSNLGNANLAAISRSYADFTARATGGPAVNLPVVLQNGSYQFDMAVQAGQIYYIDPDVAVGYDYLVGAGDPLFSSVVLPTGIGDDLYDIYGLDQASQWQLLAGNWAAGQVFSFGLDGVAAFRVLGIETAAGLDPLNTTAFVTGISFNGSGRFTGTQTPIVVSVGNVPEPTSAALVALALLSCSLTRRKAAAPLSR